MKHSVDHTFSENNSTVPTDLGKVILSVDANTGDFNLQIETMMIKICDGEFNWKCAVCGKRTKGSTTQMKRHVEIHLDGLSYSCTHCGKVCKSRTILTKHISLNYRKYILVLPGQGEVSNTNPKITTLVNKNCKVTYIPS